MRARIALLTVLLMIVPAVASATHFGDLYVIPVAGHVAGVNSSMWQTDVAIHNFQSTPIMVELAVAESGEGATDNFFPISVAGATTITLAPGATRILTDVLSAHRGRTDTIGALVVGADRPFAMTSRTYNRTASGGSTAGFTVSPTQEFLSAAGETAFVPGLVSNARFRTNLGITAAAGAGAPLVVEITLLRADGNVLGTRTFTIPAGAINHVQFGSAALSSASFDEATATIRIVSGSGDVVAYGAVVENSSNDVMLVSAMVPTATTSSAVHSMFASNLARR